MAGDQAGADAPQRSCVLLYCNVSGKGLPIFTEPSVESDRIGELAEGVCIPACASSRVVRDNTLWFRVPPLHPALYSSFNSSSTSTSPSLVPPWLKQISDSSIDCDGAASETNTGGGWVQEVRDTPTFTIVSGPWERIPQVDAENVNTLQYNKEEGASQRSERGRGWGFSDPHRLTSAMYAAPYDFQHFFHYNYYCVLRADTKVCVWSESEQEYSEIDRKLPPAFVFRATARHIDAAGRVWIRMLDASSSETTKAQAPNKQKAVELSAKHKSGSETFANKYGGSRRLDGLWVAEWDDRCRALGVEVEEAPGIGDFYYWSEYTPKLPVRNEPVVKSPAIGYLRPWRIVRAEERKLLQNGQMWIRLASFESIKHAWVIERHLQTGRRVLLSSRGPDTGVFFYRNVYTKKALPIRPLPSFDSDILSRMPMGRVFESHGLVVTPTGQLWAQICHKEEEGGSWVIVRNAKDGCWLLKETKGPQLSTCFYRIVFREGRVPILSRPFFGKGSQSVGFLHTNEVFRSTERVKNDRGEIWVSVAAEEDRKEERERGWAPECLDGSNLAIEALLDTASEPQIPTSSVETTQTYSKTQSKADQGRGGGRGVASATEDGVVVRSQRTFDLEEEGEQSRGLAFSPSLMEPPSPWFEEDPCPSPSQSGHAVDSFPLTEADEAAEQQDDHKERKEGRKEGKEERSIFKSFFNSPLAGASLFHGSTSTPTSSCTASPSPNPPSTSASRITSSFRSLSPSPIIELKQIQTPEVAPVSASSTASPLFSSLSSSMKKLQVKARKSLGESAAASPRPFLSPTNTQKQHKKDEKDTNAQRQTLTDGDDDPLVASAQSRKVNGRSKRNDDGVIKGQGKDAEHELEDRRTNALDFSMNPIPSQHFLSPRSAHGSDTEIDTELDIQKQLQGNVRREANDMDSNYDTRVRAYDNKGKDQSHESNQSNVGNGASNKQSPHHAKSRPNGENTARSINPSSHKRTSGNTGSNSNSSNAWSGSYARASSREDGEMSGASSPMSQFLSEGSPEDPRLLGGGASVTTGDTRRALQHERTKTSRIEDREEEEEEEEKAVRKQARGEGEGEEEKEVEIEREREKEMQTEGRRLREKQKQVSSLSGSSSSMSRGSAPPVQGLWRDFHPSRESPPRSFSESPQQRDGPGGSSHLTFSHASSSLSASHPSSLSPSSLSPSPFSAFSPSSHSTASSNTFSPSFLDKKRRRGSSESLLRSLPQPHFSPGGGGGHRTRLCMGSVVRLSAPVREASILYTLDQSTPSFGHGEVYLDSVGIVLREVGNVTIRARAVLTGACSDVAEATFTVTEPSCVELAQAAFRSSVLMMYHNCLAPLRPLFSRVSMQNASQRKPTVVKASNYKQISQQEEDQDWI